MEFSVGDIVEITPDAGTPWVVILVDIVDITDGLYHCVLSPFHAEGQHSIPRGQYWFLRKHQIKPMGTFGKNAKRIHCERQHKEYLREKMEREDKERNEDYECYDYLGGKMILT